MHHYLLCQEQSAAAQHSACCQSYYVGSLVSDYGLQAKSYIEKGALVPDEVMVRMITLELQKIQNTHWLLDGVCLLYLSVIFVSLTLPLQRGGFFCYSLTQTYF